MIDPVNIANLDYIEDLYLQWKKNGADLLPEWKEYFRALDRTTVSGTAVPGIRTESEAAEAVRVYKQSRVDTLIWAYRDIGYVYADINPLRQYTTPELEYMYYTMEANYQRILLPDFDLSEDDLDSEFFSGKYLEPSRMKLRDIIGKLKEIYCSTLGVEISHIKNKPMRRWLIEHLESGAKRKVFLPADRARIQDDLIRAEEFERFLHSNFVGQKRFGLEGGESLIPALNHIVRTAASMNIQEIVIGMAHRGRLNVVTNVLNRPANETFAQFGDTYKPYTYGGSGDVKYHLGQSHDYTDETTGEKVHISLLPNPSHLEAVNPVVEGKVRGLQRRRNDVNRKKVVPVLIHGDASFSGQGVVAETFNLSQLKGYRTGGTIHIIVNNQIGFTTASRDARSTFFATDAARILPAPIFHVNGDDPEAVVRAVDLAVRWRQKFGYDVVIDIFCYRRLGHNEADEPSFTHPIMYSMIKDHPGTASLYGERLASDGAYSKRDQEAERERYRAGLSRELEKSKNGDPPVWNDAFRQGEWKGFTSEYSFDFPETGVDRGTLALIAEKITTVPQGFGLHPKLQKFTADRKRMFESGSGIDWAFAESFAFGSLLLEGYSVRLSGEDVGRGTFSQRHAVYWDVSSKVPKAYIPLRNLGEGQKWFAVYDSPLSEYAVLGFDYGYSLAQPGILVLWEAQFGDFVNGAQVIIDNFITAGEAKWFRSSGLVMLLPHGFEGQGPEHSSGHLERFLNLAADDNIQVCNLTTPAQYFHVLRRQMKQNFRKPLVIMTPKSLLRHKEAVSEISDFTAGKFMSVLPDPEPPEKPRSVLFCSGHVYYDLLRKRRERAADNVAIVRIEQLYPFPDEELVRILPPPGSVSVMRWVQEEPANRGAWRFIREKIERHLDGKRLSYAGRPESSSPAAGSHRQHEEELEALLSAAFTEDENPEQKIFLERKKGKTR